MLAQKLAVVRCDSCSFFLNYKMLVQCKYRNFLKKSIFWSKIWRLRHAKLNPRLAKYQKYGFQVNQDVPGNLRWEDLYNASPNCKVILTVRDSSAKWKTSWINFIRQEYSRMGNPGFWIRRKMVMSGIMGPKIRKMEMRG